MFINRLVIFSKAIYRLYSKAIYILVDSKAIYSLVDISYFIYSVLLIDSKYPVLRWIQTCCSYNQSVL